MSDIIENVENASGIHCKHYVKRKKRFCKMTLKTGFDYCGEHLPHTNNEEMESSNILRVVCPLDNKHTCYAHKLAKHLKICNAKPNNSLPYITKGINCGDIIPVSLETSITERQLSNIKADVIKELIIKINRIYEEYVEGKIIENKQTHPIVEEELKNPIYGDRTKKHLIQASSLLGLLEQNKLVQNNICYIEFGAGKGQLSFWISKATKTNDGATILLVERSSHRHKFDNKIDQSEERVHRIKADIADFVLNQVDVLKTNKSVVGLTKHLCGDATDLALRCLTNHEVNGGKVLGAIMAFCCHHRCQWTAYTGKSFFDKCGLNSSDFDIMCGLVSWAVCGTGKSREANKSNLEMEISERDKELGLSRDQKEHIGRKCKNILDYGRRTFLQENNFKCNLHYYVDSSISPENVCLVAVKE